MAERLRRRIEAEAEEFEGLCEHLRYQELDGDILRQVGKYEREYIEGKRGAVLFQEPKKLQNNWKRCEKVGGVDWKYINLIKSKQPP